VRGVCVVPLCHLPCYLCRGVTKRMSEGPTWPHEYDEETTTGYDQAVALPAMQAGGDDAMFKENNKKFEVLDGSIELKVTSVNSELGEIGGVFVHKQPSDTDLGSKVPKDVLLKGSWFASVVEQ